MDNTLSDFLIWVDMNTYLLDNKRFLIKSDQELSAIELAKIFLSI